MHYDAQNGIKPDYSQDYIADVVKNLFTTKYDYNTKLDVLGELEQFGALTDDRTGEEVSDDVMVNYIRAFQPEYYLPGTNEVAKMRILKQLDKLHSNYAFDY